MGARRVSASLPPRQLRPQAQGHRAATTIPSRHSCPSDIKPAFIGHHSTRSRPPGRQVPTLSKSAVFQSERSSAVRRWWPDRRAVPRRALHAFPSCRGPGDAAFGWSWLGVALRDYRAHSIRLRRFISAPVRGFCVVVPGGPVSQSRLRTICPVLAGSQSSSGGRKSGACRS